MDILKHKHFLGPLIILALVVAGYFALQTRSEPRYDQVADQTAMFSPKSEDGFNVEAAGDTAGVVVEKIELKTPDLDRPGKTSAEIQKISEILKGNYDYLQGWLQLGILRKQIGDYEGAIEAWNFAGVIRPNVATPFLNLADLYAYYIKDHKRAEASFLAAIKVEPTSGFAYFQIASFYRDILRDNARAKAILEQGIAAGADSTGDLLLLLDSLK